LEQQQLHELGSSPAGGLLQNAAALQGLARERLQQLTHQQRNSSEAAAVTEQMDRLVALERLWAKTSTPARLGLPRVAQQSQANYEAILELNEALGTHLLEADQQQMMLLAGARGGGGGRTPSNHAGGGGGGGAAVEGFLMVARQILDQAPLDAIDAAGAAAAAAATAAATTAAPLGLGAPPAVVPTGGAGSAAETGRSGAPPIPLPTTRHIDVAAGSDGQLQGLHLYQQHQQPPEQQQHHQYQYHQHQHQEAFNGGGGGW
jgi:hypothetical protein